MEGVPKRHHRRHKTWAQKSLDFLRAFIAFMFSNVGVIGLVVGYAILGSFVFIWIEGPVEEQRKFSEEEVLEKRRQLTGRLWKVTCDLNMFSEESWRKTVGAELVEFQNEVVKAIQDAGYEGEGLTVNRWSFSAAFLYSLTVITSIGYGNITPKTDGGKLATILYAIIGMPLFLLYLTTIGGVLATSFKWTYSKCCKCRRTRRASRSYRSAQMYGEEISIEQPPFSQEIDSPSVDPQQVTVPITLCLSIMIGYVYGGAVLFSNWEKWNMLDGAYFCFISLSTIGFGDMVPGEMISKDEGIELRFIFCSIYLMLGMAIIAMCFNLMQEEVVQKFRNAGQKIKRLFRCARR